MTADVMVHYKKAGELEVGYIEERPMEGEGPFTAEERTLINAIAGRIGRGMERFQAEEALGRYSEELESSVRKRTAELEGAKKELEKKIREQKMAEKELLRQTTFFQSIFNSVPDAMTIADTERNVIMCNPGFEKIFGYSHEEIFGQKTKKFYASQDEFERQGRLRFNMDAEEKLKPYEVNYRRKNGEVFPSETVGTVIKSPDGETLGFLGLMRDITGRKQVEHRLTEAQRMAHIGSWELDIVNNKLWWTDETYRIFDIDKEKFEASYEAFLDRVHPDDRELVNSSYADSVRDKTPYDIVHRLIMPDNTVKYINERCETYYDDQGNPVRSVGTVQDITERRKAEAVLMESEERFRNLVVHSPAPISILNIDTGEIEYYNNKHIEMFGYKKEDAPTVSKWQELVYPDVGYRQKADEEFAEFMKNKNNVGKGSDIFERRIRCKDGTYKDVEMQFTIFQRKLIVLINDITARKRAEEVLMETQRLVAEKSAYLDSILQSSTDMAIVATNLDYVIMYYNPMAEKIFGYKAREVLGKTVMEMHTKEKVDHARFERAVEVVKKEGFYKYMIKKEEKDGPRSIESTVSGIYDKLDRLVGFVLMSHDITERLRVQAESIRTSHLTSIGELAAGVAHEINNPINGIINYARLISRKRKEGDREYEIAGRITREGNRIAAIVSSLLSFARSDLKEKKSTSLRSVLTDTIILVEAMFKKDGINISRKLKRKLPEFNVNADQIRQVFLNILMNARYALNLKFPETCPEKEIVISAETVIIDNIEYLSVAFRDSGAGMSKEVLGNVFDPFFSTKETEAGTGLGMSISHGIVTDHGGFINIESEKGEYAKVTVLLPLSG